MSAMCTKKEGGTSIQVMGGTNTSNEEFSCDGSNSTDPFSLQCAHAVSEVASPCFSAPFFPGCKVHADVTLSRKDELLVPEVTFY